MTERFGARKVTYRPSDISMSMSRQLNKYVHTMYVMRSIKLAPQLTKIDPSNVQTWNNNVLRGQLNELIWIDALDTVC